MQNWQVTSMVDAKLPAARLAVTIEASPDLERIVSMRDSGRVLTPGGRCLAAWVVEHEGKAYKIRSYPSPKAAQDQLERIRKAGQAFGRCHGAIGSYLVLDYLEAGDPCPGELPAAVGELLAHLSRSTAPPDEGDLQVWLGQLQLFGVFSRETAEAAWTYFTAWRDRGITWSLEYFDALPKNFLFDQNGRCVCIDEKSLRVGPRGLSLVKPALRLGREEFRALRGAYAAACGVDPFLDPGYREFLHFYHSAYALAYKLGNKTVGRNRRNFWFHHYRRDFLAPLHLPPAAYWRESVTWRVWYGWGSATRAVQRLLHGIRQRVA
jgi:hypothetical protein